MNQGLPPECPYPQDSLQELLEVTRAMAEGNFYREITRKLQGELGQLAEHINRTLKKLQRVEPTARESAAHIPRASAQLSEITQATEEATHRVLDLAEALLEGQNRLLATLSEARGLAGDPDAVRDALSGMERLVRESQSGLMELITQLSFQDLVGQRIKGVMGLVDEVERRILEMLLVLGISAEGSRADAAEVARKREMMAQLRDTATRPALKQAVVDDILRDLGLA